MTALTFVIPGCAAIWCSESKTVAQMRDGLHALASGCGSIFEELELLQITAELVRFGDQHLGDRASAVRHEVGAVQQRDVMVDIRPCDVAMHGALPRHVTLYYHRKGRRRKMTAFGWAGRRGIIVAGARAVNQNIRDLLNGDPSRQADVAADRA
ncbi:hypothetical protein [Bradyrhizobium japonicum]|uniref:hypothetical protein n=1 Tax=Bradyrhizobium japonicum TaxID=375 RepID=UPI0004837162|nr:hypothetical protein [Bradyrhizobium japonicum]WLB87422.1 hypothetical protein QIH91_32355 [Bradyrhizobium japonicum USDA 135]